MNDGSGSFYRERTVQSVDKIPREMGLSGYFVISGGS